MSPWPPSTLEDIRLWGFVISELTYHRREPHHTWIDTLNRLWRKNRFVTDPGGKQIYPEVLPTLTLSLLSVRHENWMLSELTLLLHPETHCRNQPICDCCPMLVLTWFGEHFLIDGTTRINRRLKDNELGPHSVLVIGCKSRW
jgi:hypothetical protein